MALFKKKQATTNIPELQEYYASQQRESTGKAWLLAIGSLLVTVALLIGSFFGGRWAYRQLTKKDTPKKVTSAQNSDTTSDTASNTSTSTTSSQSSTPATTTPSTTSTSTTTTTTTPSTSSTATTTPAQGVATTQSAQTNASATAATTTVTRVPDTGARETLLIAVIVIAVSYMAHLAYMRRQLQK